MEAGGARHVPVAFLVQAAAALRPMFLVSLRLMKAVGCALAKLWILEMVKKLVLILSRVQISKKQHTEETHALNFFFFKLKTLPLLT